MRNYCHGLSIFHEFSTCLRCLFVRSTTSVPTVITDGRTDAPWNRILLVLHFLNAHFLILAKRARSELCWKQWSTFKQTNSNILLQTNSKSSCLTQLSSSNPANSSLANNCNLASISLAWALAATTLGLRSIMLLFPTTCRFQIQVVGFIGVTLDIRDPCVLLASAIIHL